MFFGMLILLPITDFQHGSAGDTVMESAESRARKLSQGVPQHLEPLPPDVEEDGAVRLPLLTQVVGNGVGVGTSATYQSVSKQIS